nr:VWA domain-containing protein [Streptomyces regalis]
MLSDGWERGDPELLAAQMRRLHRLGHRVIWANPRKARPGYGTPGGRDGGSTAQRGRLRRGAQPGRPGAAGGGGARSGRCVDGASPAASAVRPRQCGQGRSSANGPARVAPCAPPIRVLVCISELLPWRPAAYLWRAPTNRRRRLCVHLPCWPPSLSPGLFCSEARARPLPTRTT